jgi:hypothetical protein
MHKTMSVAFCLVAASAGAETVWGDAGGCARYFGQPPATDMVFLLYPDRIERWESLCTVVGVTPLQANEQLVDVACSGEGETWADAYILGPQRADGTAIVRNARTPEFAIEIRPCQ